MVLSTILVLLAMMVNTLPVGGVVFRPFLGVMLAVCAWFAYWGAVGAVIGYAVPVFIGVPFLPALESVALSLVTVVVFVGLLRARWVDIEARRMASLIGLVQVIVITVVIRQLFAFVIFTVPALFRYNNPGALLWNFVVALFETGVTTLIVALVLLRLGTPVVKRLC